jgi:type IV secretory pathway component VirB8
LRNNATCNVSYGNAMVSTDVFEREKVIQEEREEVIFWDDYIIYGLILLAVIVMIVLFNKWRRMSKE